MTNSTTPPPWEIADYSCCDGDGKYDICFQIGRSDTGETIAELNGEGERNYKHIKRNAELVRAAPELMELLADLVNSIQKASVFFPEIDFSEYAIKLNMIQKRIRGE